MGRERNRIWNSGGSSERFHYYFIFTTSLHSWERGSVSWYYSKDKGLREADWRDKVMQPMVPVEQDQNHPPIPTPFISLTLSLLVFEWLLLLEGTN